MHTYVHISTSKMFCRILTSIVNWVFALLSKMIKLMKRFDTFDMLILSLPVAILNYVFVGQSCLSKAGWSFARDHMYSSKGQADESFLLLNLHVNGFRGMEHFADGKQVPVGKVSFTFETTCSEECSFLFMQVSHIVRGYCDVRNSVPNLSS